VARSNLLVALGDGLLQLQPLALEAVGGAALGGDALGRDLGVQAQEEGEVGPDAARCDVAERLDPVGAQAPGDPLVGDARVAEAVADHVRTGFARGQDHLLDELGARGAEEEQLGQRVGRQARVLDQLADALADVGAARLSHEQRARSHRLGETLGLRRLT
jgi:hypothetical protein